VLGIIVSLILTVSSVQAQSGQEGQQGGQYEQNQPSADDFSSSEIESFVSAREGIDELRQEFQPKFQKADDVDRAQELREDFQNKAIQVLDEEGLDVQTYNSIVKGMDSNKELRSKVEQKMNE
jgi:signal recognition particle GTPase